MIDRYDMANEDRPTLVRLLRSYGWLGNPNPGEHDLCQAVRSYQQFHGLDADGWAGPVTERSLHAFRFCGVPEAMNAEAATKKCRWPEAEITFALEGSLQGINRPESVQAYVEAMNRINRSCGTRMRYQSNFKTAHIQAKVGTIDRRGNTLAWSYLVPCGLRQNSDYAADQLYDYDEPFVIVLDETSPVPNGRVDLVAVGGHEIIHALGVPHIGGRKQLMNPTYDPSIRSPQEGDTEELTARYGLPLPEPTDPKPPTIPGPATPAGMVNVRFGGTHILVPEPFTADGYRLTKLAQ